ncbi:hypothetical protein [Streptomyces sp. SAS_272]|uniref:hypothetical protein n=1 Tax=Streptomyces sp. SAS_272 TaxID=3412747 RepID=UPI00403C305C
MSHQFDKLRTEQLLSALELRSGKRLDHTALVRMLRQCTDDSGGPRMALLERLEREKRAEALPTALRAALAASRPGQEQVAMAAKARYALILASLPGALADLPSGLLRRLLDLGVWSSERARMMVAQIVDPRVRALRLAELVQRFPRDHSLSEDLHEAAAQCTSESASGRRAISVALPLLSTQTREDLIERMLPTPGRGADRERLAHLLHHAACLAPAHVQEAETLINRAALLNGDERLTAWALLYPVLAPERRDSLLPRLLPAAVPGASPALAAALLTLLNHTDGPSHQRLQDFAAARYRLPRMKGADPFERAVARLSHWAAVSRFVPGTLAGLFLGWSLESLGHPCHERAFIPLAVTAVTVTGLPRRQVQVAAVACAVAAPGRFRNAFPYDALPSMAHAGVREMVPVAISGLSSWVRAFGRLLLSWPAAWRARGRGALNTEGRSIGLLLRASAARGIRSEAEAMDVLTRLEAAQRDHALEHDVKVRTLSDIAGFLPDAALARAVRILETRDDATEISLAIARHLPYLEDGAHRTYTALLLDRVMTACVGDPMAACRVLTVLSDHLDRQQMVTAWKALEAIDTRSRGYEADSPGPLLPLLAQASATFVPRLPTDLLPRARRLLSHCLAGTARARGVAGLARRAPSLRSTVSTLRAAAAALLRLTDPVETAMCLAVLMPVLPAKIGRWGSRHALRLLRSAADGTYDDGRQVPEVLAELVRNAPWAVSEANILARTVRSGGLRAEAIVALLPHLGAGDRQTSLDMITQSVLSHPGLTDYGRLVSTARLLPWVRPPVDELVHRLVEGVDRSWNEATRAAAFAALAESAPPSRRTDIITQGFSLAAAVTDPDDRAANLARLAGAAAELREYPARAEWTALMTAASRRPRRELLEDIGNLAPLTAGAGGSAAATEMCRALSDVSRLWP